MYLLQGTKNLGKRFSKNVREQLLLAIFQQKNSYNMYKYIFFIYNKI